MDRRDPGAALPPSSFTASSFTRRGFVAVGMALGAAALLPAHARAAKGRGGQDSPPRGRLDRIGLQLYTVRGEMRRDMAGTLSRVARIGYREVEFAGYFGRSPAEVKAMLDAAGLAAPSAHSADLGTIDKAWPKAIEDAKAIGHAYLVCPSIPAELRTADGYRRVAERFNRAGEAARAAGLRFGFHNHDADFRSLGGTTGYEILLRECDAELVLMQLDLYWAVQGGQDPSALFDAHPGRFFSVHVKDRTADGRMADVGAGVLPFGRWFAQSARAGIRHWFVEHDTPADPFVSIEASYRHMVALRAER